MQSESQEHQDFWVQTVCAEKKKEKKKSHENKNEKKVKNQLTNQPTNQKYNPNHCRCFIVAFLK